jgi:hypothetical protein
MARDFVNGDHRTFGLVRFAFKFTQDYVLGYFQPELSKLASKSGLVCR